MAALQRALAIAKQRAQLAALEGILADQSVSGISGSRDVARDAMVLYGFRALGRHRPGSDIDRVGQPLWRRLITTRA